MSVRKREWTTKKGEERSAWVLDYKDRSGVRRTETFERKKDADKRAIEIGADIRGGVHVPRSGSITVAEAGENWVARAERAGRERGTVEQYRGHLFHINHPTYGVGAIKLADLTAPQVAKFDADLHKAGVSEAMRRKLIVSLRSLLRIAMVEGNVNRNVAEGYRVEETSKRGKKLKIGVDIPSAADVETGFLSTVEKGAEDCRHGRYESRRGMSWYRHRLRIANEESQSKFGQQKKRPDTTAGFARFGAEAFVEPRSIGPLPVPAPSERVRPGDVNYASREGQDAFRALMLRAYGRCAVTGSTVEAALEVAHIIPYVDPRSNLISNGLCLRADIHRLYDRDMLRITVISSSSWLPKSLRQRMAS
jgi:hypothetical protein